MRGVEEHQPKTLDSEYETSVAEAAQPLGSYSGPTSPDWSEEQHTDPQSEVYHHRRHYSHTSEGTLVSPSPARDSSFEKSGEPSAHVWAPVGGIAFAAVERALAFLGFVVLTTGVVTYTGEQPH